jgi:CRISPR-associated protein Cmr6
MSSRRNELVHLSSGQAQHAGLWLDKFLSTQADDVRANQTLVDEVTKISIPSAYPRHFERWRRTLADRADVQVRTATARGRVMVGLGDESVLETAVTLHHTYGVPYLPGSALKGLTAAYARQRLDATWKKPDKPFDRATQEAPTPYEVLFGSTTTAGYVTFFDALFIPLSGAAGRPLHPDVLTVHHQDYYNKGGSQPPADWDSPVPVPFVSATGQYLIALAGPEAWVATALDILALALDELGIGAKTSSGYGRLMLEGLEAARARLRPSEQEDTGPRPPQPGDVITGQRARQMTTVTFNGQRMRVVAVTPNTSVRYDLPRGVSLEVYANDQTTGGGIYSRIIDIDTSDARLIRVLVQRERRPSS